MTFVQLTDFSLFLKTYLFIYFWLHWVFTALQTFSSCYEEGLFFNNIVGRNKDQRDVYIGRGQKELLEPDFTFHGFRYVRVAVRPEAETARILGVGKGDAISWIGR